VPLWAADATGQLQHFRQVHTSSCKCCILLQVLHRAVCLTAIDIRRAASDHKQLACCRDARLERPLQVRVPGAHNATDYSRWVGATEMYPVNASQVVEK
jgi:hypothetical protein